MDDYSTEFYAFLARVDLSESPLQLVSRYIGGLRLQLQDVLNMFDPLTVSEAHQRALQAKKQLARRGSGSFGKQIVPTSGTVSSSQPAHPTPAPLAVLQPPRRDVPVCVVSIVVKLAIANPSVATRSPPIVVFLLR